MKNKFREMHANMQQQQAQASAQEQAPVSKPSAARKPSGDYIDFEEVKWIEKAPARCGGFFHGGPSRARSYDPLIMSQVL